VCMRAYLCIGSRNLSTLFALFAPVPFTEICQTFAIEFSCFTTCLVSQCSAWKRDISSCSHRVLSLVFGTIQHIINLIKMFAVQQTFATKTVQVNKVNKTTKASFVQDMKKVNMHINLFFFCA